MSFVAHSSTDVVAQGSSTTYFPLGGSVFAQGSVTEADTQTTMRTVTTFTNMTVDVSSNGISAGNTTIRFRLNGTPGNLVITVPASSTGVFQDLTHTNTAIAGAVVNYQFTTAGGTTLNARSIYVLVRATTPQTNTLTRPTLAGTGAVVVTGTASTTGYFSLAGGGTAGGPFFTEASVQTRLRIGGNFNHLLLSVRGNSRTDTVTFGTRINGNNGTLVISIPTVTTGVLEDTTHTDITNSGDLLNYYLTTGADNTNTLTAFLAAVDFNSDNGQSFSVSSDAFGQIYLANAAYWAYTAGELNFNSGDSTASFTQVGVSYIASDLQAVVSANAATTISTVRFRDNETKGAMMITIGPGLTGMFEDTVNTDTVQAGDHTDYEIRIGTTGNVTMFSVAHMMQLSGPDSRFKGNVLRPRVSAPGLAR